MNNQIKVVKTEQVNLFLNIDIIIQLPEDVEEQTTFARFNIINKNILTSNIYGVRNIYGVETENFM